jgi:hypothetical protein
MTAEFLTFWNIDDHKIGSAREILNGLEDSLASLNL